MHTSNTDMQTDASRHSQKYIDQIAQKTGVLLGGLACCFSVCARQQLCKFGVI
jgi:hypothetical protein